MAYQSLPAEFPSQMGSSSNPSPVIPTAKEYLSIEEGYGINQGLYGYSANPGSNHLLIKSKYRRLYKQFTVKPNTSLLELEDTIVQHMEVKTAQASLGEAYFLWLFFGFFGAHRWYLGKHNALSWTLWFFTAQLFAFGWLWDGMSLWYMVDQYNKRGVRPEHGDFLGFFGYLDDYEPNMAVAYFLWFFFGFFGIHRWYTGYNSAPAYTVWLITGQMFAIGWLFDIYYTSRMVVHHKVGYRKPKPFVLKCFDGDRDYVPIFSDAQLAQAIGVAVATHQRVLRIAVYDTKNEIVTYLLWLFFGVIGAHYWYLDSVTDIGSISTRILTANFFVIGWIAEGIFLQELLEKSNKVIVGAFSPSAESIKVWPDQHYIKVQ